MSSTFDIYPIEKIIPSFKSVLDQSTKNYHGYLKDAGINIKPEIGIRLLTKNGDNEVSYDINDPFTWRDDLYLWVSIKDIHGGIDGYFFQNDKIDMEYWRDDIIPLERCKPIRSLLEECLSIGYHWNFRRSASQPGAINILYGIISGTIATMTNGFVFSDDSAWDFERMPINGEDFLDNYLRPNKELKKECKEWAIQCINMAKVELESNYT